MTDVATSDGVVVEHHGTCRVLTLSNPGRRNAFHPEMRRSLAARLQDAHDDPDVRAVVITGDGEHFCAGADVKRIQARTTPPTALELRENMRDVHDLLRRIVFGPKPVVAAVEGDAYGAGCSIAMASDVVVATTASRFGIAFTRIGLVPDMGLLHTLGQRVGASAAKRMMLTSAVVDGESAHRRGMADVLVEPGSARRAALDLAAELESYGPLAMALTKGALAHGITTIEDAMRAEVDLVPVVAGTDDQVEGMTALREKRPPRFTGR
ncbi:enoyl-CoA hydratase/isomerase family protein [Nocardioides sp. TF02-7]|uniref:enoyl-CoA hydratase/isomerase family protein n=1 Tax=Nocardioides sp. TF02-7 TaxID=2917724 RepID=UPI001F06AF47|nr:enoyl-CoA hydratase/isomerase family protein [Nocardioides sp. TF02-7]UMG93716.1 enoyl-CoA hydratase/isomerase family protein [Nocardioides sp. TF02-7]